MSTDRTYRAAVVERFGPPENIRLQELRPRPLNAGQVRIAVRTGGLNPVDARIRSGAFGGIPPILLGTEFAGIVAEVGESVSAVEPGEAVIGFGANGADADLVITDESRLVRKPDKLDWAVAGSLSGVGQTALTVLENLRAGPGATVLVHGASGGVGTTLVQLAVAAGYRVLGTAGPTRQEYLRGLGATPLEYGDGLAERVGMVAPKSVAASIDLAGTDEAAEIALAISASGGQAITLVPETAASHGVPLLRVRHSRAKLERLIAESLAGRLTVPVETIPFTDIAQAHRRLDSKHAVGKTVLDLSDNPHLTLDASLADQTPGA